MRKKLTWNVFTHSFNDDKIKVTNIFDYHSFMEDADKALNDYTSREKFEHDIKSSLQNHFWSRAEYEIMISGLFSKLQYKYDIYYQVMMNFNQFIDYILRESNVEQI